MSNLIECLDSLKEFYDDMFPKVYTGEASDEDCEILDRAARRLQHEGWISV